MGNYLGDFAALTPDKAAAINATTGERLSYRELDERSNRLAQHLHRAGLRRGDRVAAVLENNMRFFEIAWAAFRSGLLLVTVNRFLTPAEAAYIVNDSGARVVVSSFGLRELAAGLTERVPACEARLMVDGCIEGWTSYEAAVEPMPATPLAEQWMGGAMLYSSGSTGRPKGIVRTLFGTRVSDGPEPGRAALMRRAGFDAQTVYLSTAPLYHAAALSYATSLQFCGGTTVMMQKFDAEQALAIMEAYRVTHTQWVPTMLIRLLKLPRATREKYDLSHHRMAIHSSAPCPVDVKREMIGWWGPILQEYYSGTEGSGQTLIDSHESLQRPGSVGQAILGTLHVCDDEGRVLPPNQEGLVYFERERLPFHYHNDEAATRAAQHPQHPAWTTLGDIGRVDEDGYLYLTDRKDFMIISGGVNIYPRPIEDALSLHPKVLDVAVFGVPDADMGESVLAVVEPAPGVAPSPALAEELLAHVAGKVGRHMIPRRLEFIDTMPRLPTGKLFKRGLRQRYLQHGFSSPEAT